MWMQNHPFTMSSSKYAAVNLSIYLHSVYMELHNLSEVECPPHGEYHRPFRFAGDGDWIPCLKTPENGNWEITFFILLVGLYIND